MIVKQKQKIGLKKEESYPGKKEKIKLTSFYDELVSISYFIAHPELSSRHQARHGYNARSWHRR